MARLAAVTETVTQRYQRPFFCVSCCYCWLFAVTLAKICLPIKEIYGYDKKF